MDKEDIKLAVIVALLWGIVIVGTAWNYTSTAMHNNRAEIIENLELQLADARRDALNPHYQLLPPPAFGE